ncbi:kinesin KIN-7D, mitochondrial isoform X1 [Olea europaea subsp. europaea]|uniref:Kinesin KIN-7D, mitochondrial isoform X1 n=1 Tax=Olea europaea subsp. europaea TaxID=158383 RepID=A0A8S0RB27_OLEEU|nr:kinesin KIN-7D, mitochondrial isoform X1 [Olea europaea subsp. europaea]
MAASFSRGRSSSPFHNGKPSSLNSSTSSTSSLMNGSSVLPRTGSSSPTTSFYGGGEYGSRSMSMADTGYSGGYNNSCTPASDPLIEDQTIGGPLETTSRSGESISVTIRFRHMSEREYQSGDEIAWHPEGDKIARNDYNPMTAYAFGTVFAYGVTSSGKTHTMHGDQYSPGIIPLAIKDVFSIIQDTPGREFLLRVSYLEIYNEVINDLLDPTIQHLRVREDAQGTYVEGIKEEVVMSPGHALSFIAAGEEHRHVGSNNFNLFSSRSHTIFTLMIESSAPGDDYDGVIYSQLNLIDLAGSESSKTETTGLRRKEGSYINKSLLTLGTVIGKLSEGKASHVPYRDSKLTRLLQSSLSGHGLVSLICTVTPASSYMEETHNTLKFASRAKCVEIYASRNKIIDEKSLIKKYQREISSLKLELDQLKKGMLVSVSHEEIMSLRQQLEEGQVKMQSRLEEEEEAKAALMSRIQRLTKLILVSSKNTTPGLLSDVSSHHRSHSASEDNKLDALCDGSLLLDGENQKDSSSSVFSTTLGVNAFEHRRSSSKWNDDISQAGSVLTETTQAGELIIGSSSALKLPIDGMTMSDQMDLLNEQVKMLAGEIALSTSTLKRLVEQSVNDPESLKTQIQNLEHEIQEKKKQMGVLEQRVVENGEASVANASFVEMQQTVMKLMAQSSEKDCELEIIIADNRILQEQLQNKCAENKELLEKNICLEQQIASSSLAKSLSSSRQSLSDEYADELRKKMQYKEIENEKLKQEHVQILEENSGLRVQNQKLSEEASYAKELASAAAVELKNLTGEVTKLSLHNAKLEKELQISREMMNSKNGSNRKYSDGQRPFRRGRLNGRATDVSGVYRDDFDSWNLDPNDLKMELQVRKQREIALEAALAEKEFLEDEYRKKVAEAKKREMSLENDLANMWVLVAQLKKDGSVNPDSKINERQNDNRDRINDLKLEDTDLRDPILKGQQAEDHTTQLSDISKEESLVVRLKARIQEIKEKELGCTGNGDANSHVCKVCFESPAASMLIPCRHFCFCKPCSLACSECPICRTNIADRIFAFT